MVNLLENERSKISINRINWFWMELDVFFLRENMQKCFQRTVYAMRARTHTKCKWAFGFNSLFTKIKEQHIYKMNEIIYACRKETITKKANYARHQNDKKKLKSIRDPTDSGFECFSLIWLEKNFLNICTRLFSLFYKIIIIT